MIRADFIDVSAANVRVDFVKVKASNIKGVWFHGLEGCENIITASARIRDDVNRARDTGLLVGVYQEVYPRHGERTWDAQEQAELLAALHTVLACTLKPWAVHEDVTGKAKDYTPRQKKECVDFARDHRHYLREAFAGEDQFFYTGPGYWNHVSLGLSVSDFSDALLVCADYREISETHPAPEVPRGFDRVTLWQYAGSAGVIGKVDGVSTAVDLTCVTHGTLEDVCAIKPDGSSRYSP